MKKKYEKNLERKIFGCIHLTLHGSRHRCLQIWHPFLYPEDRHGSNQDWICRPDLHGRLGR